MSWKTKTSKVVYENPWMIVHEDNVLKPNGKEGLYGYIDNKSDGVYVVPVDNSGNTYIVKQERYTLKRTTWECVAGHTDGESAEIAAKRELEEETGLRAGSITNMGAVDVACGISTFKSTFCIARELTRVSDELDLNDGILEIQKVPLSSIHQKILTGEISCSQSIAALFMAIAYLKKEIS